MKLFSWFFPIDPSDVIKKLDVIKMDLNSAQLSIKNLAGITEGQFTKVVAVHTDQLVRSAVENFHVAMWAKDMNHKFIFVNKVFCKTILKCTEEQALNKTDDELEENSLAIACMESEKIVLKYLTTCRFIEHGILHGQHAFLDTIKSPFYQESKLIGTLGSGTIITEKINEKIRSFHHKPCITPIPIDLALTKQEMIKQLAKGKCYRCRT